MEMCLTLTPLILFDVGDDTELQAAIFFRASLI